MNEVWNEKVNQGVNECMNEGGRERLSEEVYG